jgi:hypothetical protein
MNMDTRDSLGIFWSFEDLDEHGKKNKYQDEVDGLMVIGKKCCLKNYRLWILL